MARVYESQTTAPLFLLRSYGLDYATTLFLSFFRFLLSFTLPLSLLLSLSRNFSAVPYPSSLSLPFVPLEIGRHLADGDFRAAANDSRLSRNLSAFRTHGKTIRIQSGKDVRFIVDVILSFAFAVGRKR